jgi:cell division septal protein FtsQ
MYISIYEGICLMKTVRKVKIYKSKIKFPDTLDVKVTERTSLSCSFYQE